MRKVLLVINTNLTNSGVPAVIMQIVRKLHDDFCFDILVANTKEGFYDYEFCSYGGKIYRNSLPLYCSGKVAFLKRGKMVYKMAKEIIANEHYDIIHCHNGIESGFVLKAAAEAGVPIRISHSHGTYLINGKNIFLRVYKKIGMKNGVRFSTVRLACSSAAGDTLFLKNQYEKLLNPIPVKDYLSIVHKKHDSINLIQIGYYCKLKNQLFSVNVLDRLKEHGVNAKLFFVGYDDGSGYIDLVKKAVLEKGLNDVVSFLPSDVNKIELLSEMDICLLPSESEGLPLVALESQSSHVFCIASDRVPKDVDMGMFAREPIDNDNAISSWINQILSVKDKEYSLNKSMVNAIDIDNYCDRIKSYYTDSNM